VALPHAHRGAHRAPHGSRCLINSPRNCPRSLTHLRLSRVTRSGLRTDLTARASATCIRWIRFGLLWTSVATGPNSGEDQSDGLGEGRLFFGVVGWLRILEGAGSRPPSKISSEGLWVRMPGCARCTTEVD
jgi:hypothetical protein